jgi:hypothetical protein
MIWHAAAIEASFLELEIEVFVSMVSKDKSRPLNIMALRRSLRVEHLAQNLAHAGIIKVQ